jgi:prepilin-type N-terminal cleavage/methylation domain-containing protein
MSLPIRCPRRGFTLVKLLAVIAILAVLFGLAAPALVAVRRAALRTACAHNLKQIGLAMHQHHQRNGFLPASRVAKAEGQSWAWALLPYLDQQNLYRKWKATDPYPGYIYKPGPTMAPPPTPEEYAYATQVLTSKVPEYLCPARDRDGVTVSEAFKQDVY